ncbi:MAG: IS110 family transposase [Candidatus Binataceae bacterium]|jgi:transposase
MDYKVAGIDVHKSMLAVVITNAGQEGEFGFESRKFGTLDSELKALAEWLSARQVREVVMESTAQYWKPVWLELEGQFRLYLAQAHSNRAPRGRKRDFQDAERLVRRHIAGELILSFVPDPEQRMWRTLTRTKNQLTRDRVRLHSQLEAFLEDSKIKLATCVSDLLGVSSRRMVRALADGQTDPNVLAAMAEPELQARPEQLADALTAAATMSPLHRRILGLFLDRLELIEEQMTTLNETVASAMRPHQAAVLRLAALPGFGADSAQQVIAEVGPQATAFDSPGQLASWVGVCPGREESAEVSKSNRSPKGNRAMRRILNQAAHAAAKTKGSALQALYRRLVPRLGHKKAVWAVAHRLCLLTWKILHQGVEYIEYGPARDPKALQRRTNKLIRTLRALGYQITPPPAQARA